MTPEEEILEKIKFVLSVNNDAQALRIIEQYGFYKQGGYKQYDINGVSNRRELLIDFLDDVLMCQDEGATIVDREKYVDGYLGN